MGWQKATYTAVLKEVEISKEFLIGNWINQKIFSHRCCASLVENMSQGCQLYLWIRDDLGPFKNKQLNEKNVSSYHISCLSHLWSLFWPILSEDNCKAGVSVDIYKHQVWKSILEVLETRLVCFFVFTLWLILWLNSEHKTKLFPQVFSSLF